MSTLHWLATVSGNWSTPGDWSSDNVPGGGDAVFIDATGTMYTVDSTQTNQAGSLTLVSAATLIVDTNTRFFINGAISNAGTIELNNQGNNNTFFVINAGAVTLSGGGAITLTDSAQNFIQGNSGVPGADVLTNVDNTLEGAGTIGGNGMGLDNEGVIDATGSNNALIINTENNGSPHISDPNAVTNTGTLEATGSGGLLIQQTAVDNVGGTIFANGANVNLQNALIAGGKLESSGGGVIHAVNNGSTLDGTSGNTVDNAGTVAIDNGAVLVVQGAIDNTGTIELESSNGATVLRLNLTGATLSGGGTVTMTDNANNFIQGNDNTGDALTNVDNTIEGAGSIEGGLSLDNESVIDATGTNNALIINTERNGSPHISDPNSVTNTGTLEATGSGGLLIQQTAVDNVGGVIFANGANVNLQNALIAGGTLESSGGGVIHAVNNGSTFDGTSGNAVDTTGTVAIDNGAVLVVQGAIDNTGTIELESSNGATVLRLNSTGATLSGGGTVTMTDNAQNFFDSTDNSGDALTNVDNTIEGAGTIHGGIVLDNEQHGIIKATGSNALVLDPNQTVTNAGLLEAAGSGGMLIQQAVDNAGGVIEANGSHVDLQGGDISGGTLETSNGGVIDTLGTQSPNRLDGTGSPVDITGNVVLNNNTNLQLEGAIDNSGTIALNSTGNGTFLQILTANVTLDGGGQIKLSDNANNQIAGTNSSTLTNDDNTISGAGSFSGLTLINQTGGVIDATGANALTIIGNGAVTNNGTLEASNPAALSQTGGLLIQTTIDDTGGGKIKANGSHVDLQGGVISGGTLETSNGGIIDALAAQSFDTLDGLTSAVDNTGSVVVTNGVGLLLEGAIDNTGTITLDSSGGGTFLQISNSNATLSGSGQVDLADNPNVRISGSGASTLTNESTIEGAGSFSGLTLINQTGGVIDATGANALTITGGATITNDGMLEASNPDALSQTGGLLIQTMIDDTGGGKIEANGSHVDLQGGVISGGTLETSNGGIIDALAAQSLDTLDGLTSAVDNTGSVVVTNGVGLLLEGAIDNTGTITLDSSGNGTFLQISNSNATLSGSGQVDLADNPNVRIDGSGASTLTNESTIEGAGTIGGGSLTLVNQQAGLIDATYSDNALVIDTGITVTNDGTLQANGGTLVVDDNVSGDGVAEIGGGGTADFVGAFGENVTFNGTGELEVRSPYSGTISDMSVGDSIYVANVALPTDATLSFQENAQDTGGTLEVIDPGTHTAVISLNLAGDYRAISSDDFSLTSQGNGTLITDTSASPAAEVSLPTATLNLGSFHVGATVTTPISVTNSATDASEALDVAVGGTTGDANASGSIALLGGGQTDATDIIGGLGSANDGVQSGSVLLDFVTDGTGPGGDGLPAVAIGSQFVTLNATFYKEATASITAPALLVHVGDAGSENLTVANTDSADGYSEKLEAAVTGFTGALVAASGSTEVAAGANDATSLTVGYDATQVGNITGDVTVQLASDGSGIDSFGTTQLGTIEVPVAVTVDSYAKEAITASAGDLQSNGNNYTLDLGTVEQGSSPLSSNVTISNGASGPADLLSGALTLENGSGFTNGGGTFSGLGAGQSVTAESIALQTSTLGTFSETFLIHASGSNSSGYSGALPDEMLTVTGTIAPAPDIVVSSIDAPAQALAGQEVPVTWTLENEGGATANGPWRDDVYLASDAAGENPQLVGTFTYDGSLAPGATVTRTEVVTIPALLSGNLYFVVQADATNAVDPSPGIANHEAIASAPTAVTIEPLPSLAVSSITPPTTAFSGQQAQISWTVTNDGDGGTSASSWVDKVYLSQNQTIGPLTPFDLGSDTDPLLLSVPNLTYLAPGESYTNTATITLPIGISGPYYLIVETDADDQVLEAPRGIDNISASSVVGVDLTPPPDLQVTHVLAPANVFSGQPISLSWTVTNNGSGGTVENAWSDQVWMSLDGVLDSSSTMLGTAVHAGALASGQSYTGFLNAILPAGVSGTATFFVITDYADQVYEGVLHANDTGSTATTTNLMLTPPPDLVATVTTAPTSAVAGHAVELTYKVSNDGSTTTPNSAWTDNIYLSSTPTLTGGDTLLATTTHYGALAVGQSYFASPTVDVPSGLSGSYYLIVQTNAGNSVFEVDTSNDIVSSNPITITDQPSDLEVSNVTAPSPDEAGHQVQIGWQVTNSGAGSTALASWSDEIVASASGVLGAADNIDLGTFAAPNGPNDPLAAGASYSQQENVNLPGTLNGNYKLFIVTDSGNSVAEANFANNASAGQTISVSQKLADLQVASVSAPSSVTAGSAVTLQWTVDNAGVGETDANYWYDSVYLSTTPTLTGSSLYLGQVEHVNALAAGGSYTAGGNFTLPTNLASGSYYFIVAADAQDQVTETSHADGTAASSATQVAAEAPVSAPELAVTDLTVPSETNSGQTVNVSYTVSNLGGATSRGWTDAVYLSRNQVLGSNSDIFLGYVNESALAAGASNNVSEDFAIPDGLNGPYRVFVVADPTNALNESSLANNTASSEMQVSLPPVADFSVGTVTADAETGSGSISVRYTVNNLSANAEPGSWEDAVYLSSDGTWNASDPLLGVVDHTGGVAGNGSYTGGLVVDIPGIIPGNYYVIVRTDILSESIGTNATGVSSDPVSLALPTLTPGTPATGSLSDAEGTDVAYYQLTVPAGETLDLSLASNPVWLLTGFGVPEFFTNEAINNIYVRYGALPTATDFTVASNTQDVDDPNVVLQDTQAGTYYVMVTGNSTSTFGYTLVESGGGVDEFQQLTDTEAYTLNVQTVPLSISSITPIDGSNLGSVTLTVNGAQFTANDEVELVAPGGAVLAAEQVQFVNSTQLWASFNLQGATPGDYSVELVDGAQGATLAKAFTVNSGPAGQLSVSLVLPADLREGQAGVVTVEYANIGDTDIAAPIISLNTTQAQFNNSDGSSTGSGLLTFLGINQTGPAGILQPGAEASESFSYTPDANITAHQNINFEAYTLTPTAPYDWSSFEQSLQPPTVDATDWNNVFTNFIANVGNTYASVDAAVSQAANELSQVGQSTDNFNTLVQFELLQAEGELIGANLVNAIDIATPSSLLSLSLDRTYSASLLGRNDAGLFGDGWTSSYDGSATTDSNGSVYIDVAGASHVFTLQTDGSFVAQSGDTATLSVVNGLYQMQNAGVVDQFNAEGLLGSITNTYGNTITLSYDNSANLQQVTDEATGETITLTSNAEGHVTSATDSSGTEVTYAYDPTGNLLLSVTDPAGTTNYTYEADTGSVNDNALTSVSYADGTQGHFAYNAQGLLASTSGAGGLDQTSFLYDGPGEITKTDAEGNQTILLFDAMGQIAQVQDPLGNTTQLQYDSAGRVTGIISPGNDVSHYSENAFGNIAGSTDPLGGTTSVAYAPSTQNPTDFTNQLGSETHYTYNAAGTVTGVTYQDGSGDTYQYNIEGLLTGSTDANGQTTTYNYNGAGELTQESFSGGTSKSFTYDSAGNMLTATADGVTTSYTYNSANQLTNVTNAAGQVESYSYNANGQLATMTDPNGAVTQYSYNSAGQLAELQDGSGNLLDKYTYDAAGQLVETQTGNGASTTYLYDIDGRTTGIINRNADGIVASFDDYGYNANSQVIAEDTSDGDWTYGYDANGELTSAIFLSTNASIQSQNISYVYDAAGNRVRQTVNGVATDYTTNALNQYVQVGGTTYSYDANGNVASETDSSGTTAFAYNGNNQLISQNGPGGTFHYSYDALGNLVSETDNGVTTNYVDNPLAMSISNQPLTSVAQAYNASGKVTATYDYGLGLAAAANSAGVSYFDTDIAGNVTGLSGSAGALEDSYFYLPFGQTTQVTGNASNPFQFSGGSGVITDGSGLDFMRARSYDPSLGRFTSPDPLGISASPNLYTYSNGDPVDQVDPSGLAYTNYSVTLGFIGPLIGLGLQVGDDGSIYLVPTAGVGVQTNGVGLSATVSNGSAGGASIAAQAAYVTPAGVGGLVQKNLSEGPDYSDEGGVTGGPPGLSAQVNISYGYHLGDVPNPHNDGPPPIRPNNNASDAFDAFSGPGQLDDNGNGTLGNSAFGSASYHTPHDPNDITGPVAFGPQNFVAASQPLTYTVEFENASTATGPAQTITVTEQLDPNLDWRTFRLTGFGFDNLTYNVGSEAFYSETLDLAATKGYNVVVTAGVNVATGLVTWTFQTIDPATGQTPLDPTVGLLPVNDANNDGDGFVSYTVQAKAGVQTGDVVEAQATVVFDNQPPINTPIVSDTLDAVAPTSQVQALPAQTSDPTFEVSWSGQDNPAGSGIAGYNIYVSTDGGPSTPWLTDTTLTNALFTGQTGHSYAFSSTSISNAGNAEAVHSTADAAILVGQVFVSDTGGATVWTEASGTGPSTGVAIDSGLTVSDLESATLASATVTITNGFQSAEDVLAFTNDGSTMGNIGASYNAGTGVMTLTSSGATATLAQWQAALDAVTYNDSSHNPTGTSRTISLAVNDGTLTSPASTKTVNLTAMDTAPTVTTSGGTTLETDQVSAAVDTGVTVTDVDNTTLASATVSITGGFQAGQDFLAAPAFGNISGSYNASTGVLTITSSGAPDTLAQFQAELDAVTYTDTSTTPNTANRTISFVVSDGTLASTAATKTVSVVAPIHVTVQTASGIDQRWATLYDEMTNSAISAGGTAAQYTAVDSGQFNGHTAAIKFVVTGTGFTYSGSSPDIQLTGGTITGIQEQDSLSNVLATLSGFSISATTFQAALNSYVAGGANPDPSGLNTIFLALPYSVTGGPGPDLVQGGNLADTFQASTGNDTIDGGGGTNIVDYSDLTTPGLFAIVQGGSGSVQKGGANGIDTLTNVQDLIDTGTGRTNSDVFEVDANENVTAGSSNFNYLIELSANANLAYGTDFTGITEFVANVGTNTINFSSDPDFAYLYGSVGNDALTLGAGGGYLFAEGGTNTLVGGANATNLFVGGQGGTDTMNGGTGTASNFYFVDGNDQVNGAGAFNTMIELVSGVTVQLGTQYQDVQEFVSNIGNNTVTVANTDSDFIYLYGSSGNDSLTTGAGGGYLIGEGGTNTLTGGDGLNVFVADSGAGVDTMNGGSGSNVYFIDANSAVHGAGTFNTVIELQQNASLTLGSAQLGADVQQVVFNSGSNSADFHVATTSVYLYGGSGNDTLFGGTGNDFLYGGTGTNTFTFGAGWGQDTIEDWTAGTNSIIDLTALAGSGVHAITDLMQSITSGNDVITSSHTGSNSITLMGVGSALTAGSFHFA